MRWGIVADVHGNLEAWQAVLAALQKEGLDRYICLGDIVGYGANPRECIAEIASLKPLSVAGNHDWASVGLFETRYFNPTAQKALLWTAQNLSLAEQTFLKSLKLVHQEDEFTLVHASLQEPGSFGYILDLAAAAGTFRLLHTQICFVGHSHAPVTFIQAAEGYSYTVQPEIKLAVGQAYIVNAGSVGQPRDRDPRAAYVIYDSQKKLLQVKRVPYDIHRAQERIIRAGLPRFLAERLAQGR